mmetsp:Transcript_13890/g.23659  ORF Transcript_13890/g.23659 Transcript_13890/m.23659 type:complete len:208 (+) Transcript_13890:208-831(+)
MDLEQADSHAHPSSRVVKEAAVEMARAIGVQVDKSVAIELDVHSEIPQGSGMGSSAAFSCAISASILHSLKIMKERESKGALDFEGLRPDKQEIGRFANLMEKVFHTNPSGCDVQVILNGGLLRFQKGQEGAGLQLRRFDRPLNLNFLVVDTRRKREARETIEKVRRLKEENEEEFTDLIGILGDTTDEIVECLGLEAAQSESGVVD